MEFSRVRKKERGDQLNSILSSIYIRTYLQTSFPITNTPLYHSRRPKVPLLTLLLPSIPRTKPKTKAIFNNPPTEPPSLKGQDSRTILPAYLPKVSYTRLLFHAFLLAR
jgi:hypothetical protein